MRVLTRDEMDLHRSELRGQLFHSSSHSPRHAHVRAQSLGAITITNTALFWLVVSCLIGMGISWAGFWCQSLVSATTYTVVGVMNKMLTVAMNVLVWDNHASTAGIASLGVCILGGSLYQQAPLRDTAAKMPLRNFSAVCTPALLPRWCGYWSRRLVLEFEPSPPTDGTQDAPFVAFHRRTRTPKKTEMRKRSFGLRGDGHWRACMLVTCDVGLTVQSSCTDLERDSRSRGTHPMRAHEAVGMPSARSRGQVE